MDSPNLESLLDAFSDASFDCGEWKLGDESSYNELFNRLDLARKELVDFINNNNKLVPYFST